MAGDLHYGSVTRRHMLLGATAIAINALAAACGQNVPATPVATVIPAAGTRLAPNLATTTVPTAAAALLPTATIRPVPTALATTGTPTTPLIVFAGGALSGGDGVSSTESFAALTIALLAPTKYDAAIEALHQGEFPEWNSYASQWIDPLFARSRSKNLIVLHGGGNDMAQGGQSVADAFARMVAYCQDRRSVGWKVVVLTILPRTGFLRTGEDFEAERQEFNALMRKNLVRFADGLADIGADPTIGIASARGNWMYYQVANGILPTAAGHRIIAPIVKAAILTL